VTHFNLRDYVVGTANGRVVLIPTATSAPEPSQHEDDENDRHAECFGVHPGGADGIVDCDGEAI
jgi:hypothetical protein